MSCHTLKSELELTIQTPAFSYNEEQQECMDGPLLSDDINNILSRPPGFSMQWSGYSCGNKKEQSSSMIGHDHTSRQGVYMMNTSFHSDANKRTSSSERDHMAHIKKNMADDSFHGVTLVSHKSGGQKCQRPGCNEGVEGQMAYCKNHGGRPCQQLGCLQSTQGSADLCIPRGGDCNQCTEPGSSAVACVKPEFSIKYEGDNSCPVDGSASKAESCTALYVFHGESGRCKYHDCSKRAQVNTMFCKTHSAGGKCCMVQGCLKGAHGGTPLCIGHGGGKRCAVPGCPNAACGSSQGRTDRCVRHGGGKRCKFEGCGKGAQGNTDFCIAHGGGKRCKFEGCGKSAQGRTDFCIRHGGGRRCKFEGCNTSAKWGKDFCSVHRRSLTSGSDDTHEMPPVAPKRRGPKKAKRIAGAPALPPGIVTVAAKAGSSTSEMGILHATTAVSDQETSPESVAKRRKAARDPQVPAPLSMKSSPPSGPAVSSERGAAAWPAVPAEKDAMAAARSRALLGL